MGAISCIWRTKNKCGIMNHHICSCGVWMNLRNYFRNNIENSERENFKEHILSDNLHRGKILAIMMIGFDLILSIADISSSYLKLDTRFQFNAYLVLYIVMIFLNIFYLFLIRLYEKTSVKTTSHLRKFEIGILLYITLIMSWGSVVSLMDQKLYGSLVVFMVNMIICSVIYFLEFKRILVPYLVSSLILFIGLPFFSKF